MKVQASKVVKLSILGAILGAGSVFLVWSMVRATERAYKDSLEKLQVIQRNPKARLMCNSELIEKPKIIRDGKEYLVDTKLGFVPINVCKLVEEVSDGSPSP